MNSFFLLGASTQRERISSLKKAFDFIAKEDISLFVKHLIFSTNFGKDTFLPVINEQFNSAILMNIKDLMESSPTKHLPALRSLIAGQYSLAHLQALGFSMTRNEYNYSKKIHEQRKATLHNYTRAVPPSKEKIKDETLKKIITELLKNSFPTSQPVNKKLKEIYKKIENEIPEYSTKIKFSLTKTKKEIYEKMITNKEIDISLDTYYKKIPSNFIKSKKETDKCNICDSLESLQKKENDYRRDGVIVPKKIKDDIKAIQNHKKFKDHQKEQYEKDLENLKENDAIIIVDFKENFKVGGGPTEANRLYYSKTPVSVLGFALITKNSNKVTYEYYDFLSEILSHDSLFAGECLIKLLNLERFNTIHNLKIWSDNGNHFRSHEFLYFVFIEAPKIIKGDIKFNRFAEGHGKSAVDGHFGVITKLFRQKEKERRILNIHDLKEVFETEEIRKSQKNNSSNDTVSQKTFFYLYDRESRSKQNLMQTNGLHLYLSYTFKEEKLYASPLTFSNLSEYKKVSYNINTINDMRETRRSLGKSVQNKDDDISAVGSTTRSNIEGRINFLTKMTTYFSDVDR